MTENLLLDVRALDRARISRDPRFDGKFFIAVTSTGIYCRSICPVRSPKKTNIRYYATAAAAAEAGFRPCLRCRPESAPGSPAWMGTSAIVRRALRLIENGVLDEDSVDGLAARVGVGARHLLRLFVQHVGASPIAVAQTRRLHFAKHLLNETRLPITAIALASGFTSLRRFNSAFHQTYKRPPRELRRHRSNPVTRCEEIVLRLAFRPPYDWVQVRDFLALRSIPGVERVDERGYARTIAWNDGHVIVCVRPVEYENELELHIRGATPAALMQLTSAARQTFDLAADPLRIMLAFKSDALLAPLVQRRPGVRIPGAWDPFECAVRAVLGQQVSVAAGRTFAARLVSRIGKPIIDSEEGLTHLFPSATVLAETNLVGLGLTSARVGALQALARAVMEGIVDFGAPPEQVTAALSALPGIGSWTAQYVALRALGDPDAFPVEDLVLRRMANPSGAFAFTARALEKRSEQWRPWRGYAAMHLWLGAKGHRGPASERILFK